METPKGKTNGILGTTMLGGGTSTQLPGTSKAHCKPGDTGHHLGLYSGTDK